MLTIFNISMVEVDRRAEHGDYGNNDFHVYEGNDLYNLSEDAIAACKCIRVDGNTLEHVRANFSGIRMNHSARVVFWSGADAKFILRNLNYPYERPFDPTKG